MALIFLLVMYCVVQAVRDYRRGAYLMAAAGVACALLLLLIPIESQVIKVDIPRASP
jgi:hypothetical protein